MPPKVFQHSLGSRYVRRPCTRFCRRYDERSTDYQSCCCCCCCCCCCFCDIFWHSWRIFKLHKFNFWSGSFFCQSGVYASNFLNDLELYLGQILSPYEAKKLGHSLGQISNCIKRQYIAQIKIQIVKQIACVDATLGWLYLLRDMRPTCVWLSDLIPDTHTRSLVIPTGINPCSPIRTLQPYRLWDLNQIRTLST